MIGILVGRLPLSVTIVPDGTGAVGKVEFESDAPPQARRHFDTSAIKRNYARAIVLGELAGSIAQDILKPGRVRDSAGLHDARCTRELAEEMVVWEDVDGYLDAAREETATLLRKHWPAVEALAQALLNQPTMQRDEIMAVA